MKTYKANLLNSITLIIMPIWAFLAFEGTQEKPDQSFTAFIPLIFGFILLLCNRGLKKEHKTIAHVAVFVTIVALLGLTMPLKAAIADDRGTSVLRIVIMIITGIISMITFVKSFIEARKNR